MVEDLPLQTLQLDARLYPELVVEELAGATVELEGIRLASGEVKRSHQLRSRALPERRLLDQRREFLDDEIGAAACNPRVHAICHDRVMELLETSRFGLCE